METRKSFLKKCVLVLISSPLSCAISGKKKLLPQKRNIKKVLVLWYSQTGHTEIYGKLISHVWQKRALKVTGKDIRDFDSKKVTSYDLILIGSPVFYYDTPPYIYRWIESMPEITGTPVASYVTFGGPEGDQHNAVSTIVNLLSEKGGVPVGIATFMNMGTFPMSWPTTPIKGSVWKNSNLPSRETYKKVRTYATDLLSRIKQGKTIEADKRVTMRRISTIFGPIWWTKRLIDNHSIDVKKCITCKTCIKKCPVNVIDLTTGQVDTDKCELCFGCINNCPVQAVTMIRNETRLIGFFDFLKRNKIKRQKPVEFRNR